MKKIILASQSPRRRELLDLIGFDFEVMPSGCEENEKAQTPAELVRKLSCLKCMDVADGIRNGKLCPKAQEADGYLVIGADTIVVFGGAVIGAPGCRRCGKNPEDAAWKYTYCFHRRNHNRHSDRHEKNLP